MKPPDKSPSDQYSVEIVARGEGLVYKDGERTLNFLLYRNRDPGLFAFYPVSRCMFFVAALRSSLRSNAT